MHLHIPPLNPQTTSRMEYRSRKASFSGMVPGPEIEALPQMVPILHNRQGLHTYFLTLPNRALQHYHHCRQSALPHKTTSMGIFMSISLFDLYKLNQSMVLGILCYLTFIVLVLLYTWENWIREMRSFAQGYTASRLESRFFILVC